MDRCFCYEKFKDRLPEGVKTTCFKEQCRNYRENIKKINEQKETLNQEYNFSDN